MIPEEPTKEQKVEVQRLTFLIGEVVKGYVVKSSSDGVHVSLRDVAPSAITSLLKNLSAMSTFVGLSGKMDLTQYSNHVDIMLKLAAVCLKDDYKKVLMDELKGAIPNG